MQFNTRRDQYAYLIGYISRTRKIQLGGAIGNFIRNGYKNLLPEDVFDFCPFNDDFKQSVRNCRNLKNTKLPDISGNIYRIIEEYVFLYSDFHTSDYGGSRAFCVKTDEDEIALCCEWYGKLYDLDERNIERVGCKNMVKSDFIDLFGTESFSDWPFHGRLAGLKHKGGD